MSQHPGPVPDTERALRPELFDRITAEEGTNGLIVIDPAAVGRNFRCLANRVAPAECACVVKADCYGLGTAGVLDALDAAGAQSYFVALPSEAEDVRSRLPDARIFVLDGVLPGQEDGLLALGAIPVLSSLPEIEHWSGHARRLEKRLPCALHIDSGLNRLGLEDTEVAIVEREPHRLDGLDVRLVMSHLACADEADHPKNEAQLSAFLRQTGRLPRAPRSLAASDGLMLGGNYHFDMVRPGYALYGGQALPGRITPVEPVVEVHARVLQVRTLAPGDTVGYSATFAAQRPSRIAIIASGYADGTLRHLSAETGVTRGQVAFAGHLAPIVGRVSMDLITADITDLPADVAVQRGSWAELIGPTITLEDVGRASGTIGYEVLTRLSPRFSVFYASCDSLDG